MRSLWFFALAASFDVISGKAFKWLITFIWLPTLFRMQSVEFGLFDFSDWVLGFGSVTCEAYTKFMAFFLLSVLFRMTVVVFWMFGGSLDSIESRRKSNRLKYIYIRLFFEPDTESVYFWSSNSLLKHGRRFFHFFLSSRSVTNKFNYYITKI